MMRINRSFVFLSLIIIGFCQSLWAEKLRTERTVGEQQQWFEKFFERTALEVAKEGNAVHFVSDGSFGLWVDNSWVTDFALKKGATFVQQPDHHAMTEFKVTGVGDEAVEIGYKAQFDHRSFGPNLITVDEGKVAVPYKY